MTQHDAQRSIPPVHRFLSDERIAAYEPALGHANLKSVVTGVLDQARADGAVPGYEDLSAAILRDLAGAAAQTLQPVINGTGVLLHTNFGRAPISRPAWEEAAKVATGYSNLEYDVATGQRGSRYSRLAPILRELTGAQDGVVVNNCAAAVVLILDTFAKGRDVIVARNELIEIGGGFRLPDVFTRSGARLVEVGAANRVYLHDYERALNANSALLFRSHLSNFRLSGFTHVVAPGELVALGRTVGLPVVEDLGSGALVDFERFGLPHERTVQEAMGDGVSLVAFSGDKLLGGPQAGIIVGKRTQVARLRSNPLMRALRVDKITIALLAQILGRYKSAASLLELPLFAMLSVSTDELRARAKRYTALVPSARALPSQAYVGGGAFPDATVSSVAVAVPDSGGAIERAMRAADPPIIGRLDAGRLFLDLRTIAPDDDALVMAVLAAHA
jgi:L-seryl-tRNA(Ser) seleniumtransferase